MITYFLTASFGLISNTFKMENTKHIAPIIPELQREEHIELVNYNTPFFMNTGDTHIDTVKIGNEPEPVNVIHKHEPDYGTLKNEFSLEGPQVTLNELDELTKKRKYVEDKLIFDDDQYEPVKEKPVYYTSDTSDVTTSESTDILMNAPEKETEDSEYETSDDSEPFDPDLFKELPIQSKAPILEGKTAEGQFDEDILKLNQIIKEETYLDIINLFDLHPQQTEVIIEDSSEEEIQAEEPQQLMNIIKNLTHLPEKQIIDQEAIIIETPKVKLFSPLITRAFQENLHLKEVSSDDEEIPDLEEINFEEKLITPEEFKNEKTIELEEEEKEMEIKEDEEQIDAKFLVENYQNKPSCRYQWGMDSLLHMHQYKNDPSLPPYFPQQQRCNTLTIAIRQAPFTIQKRNNSEVINSYNYKKHYLPDVKKGLLQEISEPTNKPLNMNRKEYTKFRRNNRRKRNVEPVQKTQYPIRHTPKYVKPQQQQNNNKYIKRGGYVVNKNKLLKANKALTEFGARQPKPDYQGFISSLKDVNDEHFIRYDYIFHDRPFLHSMLQYILALSKTGVKIDVNPNVLQRLGEENTIYNVSAKLHKPTIDIATKELSFILYNRYKQFQVLRKEAKVTRTEKSYWFGLAVMPVVLEHLVNNVRYELDSKNLGYTAMEVIYQFLTQQHLPLPNINLLELMGTEERDDISAFIQQSDYKLNIFRNTVIRINGEGFIRNIFMKGDGSSYLFQFPVVDSITSIVNCILI